MTRHALLLIGLLAAAPAIAQDNAAPAGPPKPDPAKGQAISANVCGACHAADGSRGAPANPIIAGQHTSYIVKQLTEYKSGARKNAVMQGMAAALSEQDMRNVAAFYASKEPKPGFAKNKDSVALGQRIWRGGLADRQIPACAGCHSPSGAGIPAQYPRLAGQHADYTEHELEEFRDGGRTNSAEMSAVAAKLTDREIRALADYIAGLR